MTVDSSPNPAPTRPKLRRGPFILLGLMTLFTFGGPVLIGLVLLGGPRPGWPPDRTVEWVTFVGTCSAVVALMVACLVSGRANRAAKAGGKS